MTNNIYKGVYAHCLEGMKKRAGEIYNQQRKKAQKDLFDYMDMIIGDTEIDEKTKYCYLFKVYQNYKDEIYAINKNYIKKIVDIDREREEL